MAAIIRRSFSFVYLSKENQFTSNNCSKSTNKIVHDIPNTENSFKQEDLIIKPDLPHHWIDTVIEVHVTKTKI